MSWSPCVWMVLESLHCLKASKPEKCNLWTSNDELPNTWSSWRKCAVKPRPQTNWTKHRSTQWRKQRLRTPTAQKGQRCWQAHHVPKPGALWFLSIRSFYFQSWNAINQDEYDNQAFWIKSSWESFGYSLAHVFSFLMLETHLDSTRSSVRRIWFIGIWPCQQNESWFFGGLSTLTCLGHIVAFCGKKILELEDCLYFGSTEWRVDTSDSWIPDMSFRVRARSLFFNQGRLGPVPGTCATRSASTLCPGGRWNLSLSPGWTGMLFRWGMHLSHRKQDVTDLLSLSCNQSVERGNTLD